MKEIKTFLIVMGMICLCFCVAWWDATYAQANVIDQVETTTTLLSKEAISYTDEEEIIPTIMLDAGHGGYDCGSLSYDGEMEKDITLSITLQIGEWLEEAGYHVVYTRTNDEVTWESDNLSDLQTRVSMAVAQEADYYVSIHMNFSSYGDGASGFESYLNEQDETIVQMAQAIHRELSGLHISNDRGLKSTEESPLYVIDQNPIPALLLELGFLSDESDTWYLLHAQEALAQAIATGIMNSVPLSSGS